MRVAGLNGCKVFNEDPLNRFQLYYYANGEFKKDERKDTILTIDTRLNFACIFFFRESLNLNCLYPLDLPIAFATNTVTS